MPITDDQITATSQLTVTGGAGGPVFADFVPLAGKAYVLGKLGVGAINPQNALDVEGAMAVGAGYSGDVAAPANGLIVEGNVGIGTPAPSTRLHLAGTSPALRITDGSQGNGKVLVSDASGNAAWKDNSRYFAANLPTNAITATPTAQKIADVLTFTKAAAGSAVEVHMNTRVDPGGAIAFVAAGRVSFQLRIDDAVSSIANVVQVPATGGDEFISIFAVFQSLAAGAHTASVWAYTSSGLSGSVNLNPDGSGKIVVKETF